MRAVLIGSVQFSAAMLEQLLSSDSVELVGVCTLTAHASDSDRIDLTPLCLLHGIPVRYTPDVNSEEVLCWIGSLNPDVVFCFGWSRLIDQPLLDLAPHGVVGYHPSALPANRGRHPLIWALALGLEETGSTFFAMDEGTDTGNILSQRLIPIDESGDASSLYKRVIAVAVSQLDEVLENLTTGNNLGMSQDEGLANYWRKRQRQDGEIDWRMPATGIKNLVRALALPYVGAHFAMDSATFTVWRCEVVDDSPANAEPGKVLRVSAEGILVKCGIGAVLLTQVEPYPSLVEGEYIL